MSVQIISEDYRNQNEELHKNESYGTSGASYRDLVRAVSDYGRKGPILDFGCGKRTLSRALGPAYRVTDYDPCIPGLDSPPDPHPIVVCTDVLEHIEPDYLDNVLGELRRLTKEKAFIAVALRPSKKTLPDGRNAHLIQKPPDWWSKKLEQHGLKIESEKPAERTNYMKWWILV